MDPKLEDDQIISGIRIDTGENPFNPEEDDAIRNEAIRRALQEEQIQTRKAQIMARAMAELQKGNRIDIDEEVIELGLEEKIRALLLEAEMHYKLNKYLMNDDDFDYTASSDSDWLDD
jgi:hypothetical protein